MIHNRLDLNLLNILMTPMRPLLHNLLHRNLLPVLNLLVQKPSHPIQLRIVEHSLESRVGKRIPILLQLEFLMLLVQKHLIPLPILQTLQQPLPVENPSFGLFWGFGLFFALIRQQQDLLRVDLLGVDDVVAEPVQKLRKLILLHNLHVELVDDVHEELGALGELRLVPQTLLVEDLALLDEGFGVVVVRLCAALDLLLVPPEELLELDLGLEELQGGLLGLQFGQMLVLFQSFEEVLYEVLLLAELVDEVSFPLGAHLVGVYELGDDSVDVFVRVAVDLGECDNFG